MDLNINTILYFLACGLAPLHPRHEVRIVGGRNSAFGSWPWQVNNIVHTFYLYIILHSI